MGSTEEENIQKHGHEDEGKIAAETDDKRIRRVIYI